MKLTRLLFLQRKALTRLHKKFSKNANVAISNPEQLYLTAKYVTKGNAIQVLQHVFNSSEEDTVVFGGGYNDIEMFGHAYFSYAMQWADSEVRRSAKHIAENVNTILRRTYEKENSSIRFGCGIVSKQSYWMQF